MPNNRPPRHVRQKLIELKGERDNSTITVGDFTTVLSIMGRMTKWKISKELEDWDNCINRLDPTDITRTLFLSACGSLSSTDHMLGHESCLSSQNVEPT